MRDGREAVGAQKTAAERTSSMTGERCSEKTWKTGIKHGRAHLFRWSSKKFKAKVKPWANGRSQYNPGQSVAASCLKESLMDSTMVLKWLSRESGAVSYDGCERS